MGKGSAKDGLSASHSNGMTRKPGPPPLLLGGGKGQTKNQRLTISDVTHGPIQLRTL